MSYQEAIRAALDQPNDPETPRATWGRLAYPIPEAASVLGVGRTSMYALIDAGEVETIHIGRRRVVPHDSLVDYVQRKRGRTA